LLPFEYKNYPNDGRNTFMVIHGKLILLYLNYQESILFDGDLFIIFFMRKSSSYLSNDLK